MRFRVMRVAVFSVVSLLLGVSCDQAILGEAIANPAEEGTLPDGAIKRLGSTRLRHAGRLNCVVVSGDRKYIVSGGTDGTIRFWDPRTGAERKRLAVKWSVTSLASSRDKPSFLVSSAGNVYIHDLESGKTTSVHVPSWGATCVGLVPKSDLLVFGDKDGGLSFADVRGTFLERVALCRGEVRSLAGSPDGKRVVVLGGDMPTLWLVDVEQRKVLKSIKADSGYGSLDFSGDGKRFLFAGAVGTSIFDAKEGIELYRVPRRSPARFGPEEDQVLGYVGGRKVELFNYVKGGLIRTFEVPGKDYPSFLYFQELGLLLAWENRVIGLYDWKTGRPLLDLPGHDGPILALAAPTEGDLLISGGKGRSVIIWDWKSGTEKKRLAFPQEKKSLEFDHIKSIGVSADGRVLAVCARSDAYAIRLFHLPSGKYLRTLIDPENREAVISFAFHPKESRLLASYRSSSDRCHLCLWDLDKPEVIKKIFVDKRAVSTQKNQVVWSLSFSPSGEHWVSSWSDLDGNSKELPARVKKARSKQSVFIGSLEHGRFEYGLDADADAHYAGPVAWSPTGDTIAAILRRPKCQLVVWSLHGEKDFRVLGEDRFLCLRFSPDGKRVAAGLANGEVCLWDVNTGRLLKKVQAHHSPINAILFLENGRKLATAADDTFILIWDVAQVG